MKHSEKAFIGYQLVKAAAGEQPWYKDTPRHMRGNYGDFRSVNQGGPASPTKFTMEPQSPAPTSNTLPDSLQNQPALTPGKGYTDIRDGVAVTPSKSTGEIASDADPSYVDRGINFLKNLYAPADASQVAAIKKSIGRGNVAVGTPESIPAGEDRNLDRPLASPTQSTKWW